MSRTATAPAASASGQRSGRRGPFVRWPRVADAVLAAVLLALSVWVDEGPGDSLVYRPLSDVPPAALAVLVLAAGALALRRRRPLVVLTAVLTAWAALLVTGYSAFADVGGLAIVAVYTVGRYVPDVGRAVAGLVATVVVVVADTLPSEVSWGGSVAGLIVTSLAWYVGQRLQLRRARALQAERDRAAEARRIITEERTRIARELHDVVAHQVSLMTVQAGAAQAVLLRDPERAAGAMRAVEEAGRQALGELRHLLDVLRPEPGTSGLDPQPGLADLPRLVEQVARAGLDVSLVVTDLPPDLPTRVDLFAFRIVQEALTNVLKHAGPGVVTQVRVAGDGDGIRVEVVDSGRAHPGSAPHPGDPSAAPDPPADDALPGGHGIIGMRERALLLGGALDVGPRAGGGFRVMARLPWTGGPA